VRSSARQTGAEFVPNFEAVCQDPQVDYVDVCTLPDFRLQPVEVCAESRKHVLVQKPMATSLSTAREMMEVARRTGIHSAWRGKPA
jgi:UDP-N-acetyl-2-amino-2-deoxyglucuronate dehydrogenase